jgi:tetratricopeptide (TPR) repeat protein
VARADAVKEKNNAQESEMHAVASEKTAQTEKERAEEAAKIAEDRRKEAQAATERAQQAQTVAEQQKQEAQRSALETLRAAMRARKQSLTDKSNINTLAERLIQLASPKKRLTGATITQLRSRNWALRSFKERVVEGTRVFGDNVNALTNRGYMSLIRFDTAQALKDFQRIREIDPQYSLNYLNLGVTEANLKDYGAAENSIQQAIQWYRPGLR